MKLNTMNPAKRSTPDNVPPTWSDSAASSHGAADEAENLQTNTADPVGEQHGKYDSHDQQHVDERGSFRGQDIALNELGRVARMIDAGADQREDGGGKDSDAVGAEVLQEPWHRSEDGPAQICSAEQRGPGRAPR